MKKKKLNINGKFLVLVKPQNTARNYQNLGKEFGYRMGI